MAEKPREPKVGSHARDESRAKDLAHARGMVLEILRHVPQSGKAAVASLEEWLTRFPELRPMVAQHFDLCTDTENVLIGRLTVGNAIAKHVIKQEIDALKSELTGDAPTGLMRILASTVAVAHLAYQEGTKMASNQAMTPAETMVLDRHAESVQKRLFRAIEFLDTFSRRQEETTASEPAKVGAKVGATGVATGVADGPVHPDAPHDTDNPHAPGYPKLAD